MPDKLTAEERDIVMSDFQRFLLSRDIKGAPPDVMAAFFAGWESGAKMTRVHADADWSRLFAQKGLLSGK